MNNDFQLKSELSLYDQLPSNISYQLNEPLEIDSPNKNHHISSICYKLKKKIKHQQNRPSILKIEDSGRNVKIYSNVPSSNNLEKQENDIE